MRSNKLFIFIGLSVMILLLSSCANTATVTENEDPANGSSFGVSLETPTESVPSSPVVNPSVTPSGTLSDMPSATPSPSNDPTSTPTPTPEPSVSNDSPTPSDDLPPFPAVSVKDAEIFVGDTLDLSSLLTIPEGEEDTLSVKTDGSGADLSSIGSYKVTFTVTDAHGRSKVYTATVTVKERPDTTPPTIVGSDFQITLGEGVSYKKQVTVSDDSDPYPTLTVDNSGVDLETPGVYPVIYTAKDKAGNTATLTIYLTVVAKEPDLTETEKYVYGEAEKILARITTDDMSKLDVAYAIYRWSKNNIGYWGTTDKSDWITAAYTTLTTGCGDCYGFYAVSKALMTVAGIDHYDLVKDRQSEEATRHYWFLVNVGDGWYHFDTTRFRYPESNFFMLTNEEILAWDATYYPGTHTYIKDGVPEVATKSIQDRVDYESSQLKY